MFDVDTSEALASLLKYRDEMKVKFEQMVVRVVKYWSEGIVEVTPVGDSVAYSRFYNNRPQDWANEEGLLLGNWKIRNGAVGSYTWDSQATDTSGANITRDANRLASEYKLGEMIVIYNATPYAMDVAVRGTNGMQTRDIKGDATQWLAATYLMAYSGLN
jgi:hypothetical protein